MVASVNDNVAFTKKSATGATEVDLNQLGQAVQQTAERVGKPIIGPMPSEAEMLATLQGAQVDPYGNVLRPGQHVTGARSVSENPASTLMATTARGNMLAQAQSLEAQAANQKTGIEVKGAEAIASLDQLQRLQASAEQTKTTAASAWQVALDKADDAVKNANERMAEVMGKLDTMIGEVGEGLDFARAHAIQSTSVGVLNSMQEAERNIVSQFGRNSPEHQQFMAQKATSLQSSISQIHEQIGKLATEARTTLTGVWGQTAQTMASLVNYQEKGQVEAYTAAAQAVPMMELQTAGLMMEIERYKSTVLSDIADTLSGASVLRLDTLPLATLLGDWSMANAAEQRANMPTNTVIVNTPASWGRSLS